MEKFSGFFIFLLIASYYILLLLNRPLLLLESDSFTSFKKKCSKSFEKKCCFCAKRRNVKKGIISILFHMYMHLDQFLDFKTKFEKYAVYK